jgi:hypothetical protein
MPQMRLSGLRTSGSLPQLWLRFFVGARCVGARAPVARPANERCRGAGRIGLRGGRSSVGRDARPAAVRPFGRRGPATHHKSLASTSSAGSPSRDRRSAKSAQRNAFNSRSGNRPGCPVPQIVGAATLRPADVGRTRRRSRRGRRPGRELGVAVRRDGRGRPHPWCD